MDTPDEVRETALRAVKWLKTSRAKAAPDALATIAYLAAREQILSERLMRIELLVNGCEFTAQAPWVHGHQSDPQRQESGDVIPQIEGDLPHVDD